MQVHSEQELIRSLLDIVNSVDPDVVVGHNFTGNDLLILQSRLMHQKLSWWKLGRLRYSGFLGRCNPNELPTRLVSGRLVVDTYTSAKELTHEDDYSLSALALKYASMHSPDMSDLHVSVLFSDANRLCGLVQSLLLNTNAAVQVMFGLQIIPLTHQIACISGLPWNRCLRPNRSERVEYYLLHGFHKLGYITPDKQVKVRRTKRVSKYEGGLVLEPKADLYEDFILVLDFNSLYPSIIQEYNLCYTTVKRDKKEDDDEALVKEEDDDEALVKEEDEDGDVVITEEEQFQSLKIESI